MRVVRWLFGLTIAVAVAGFIYVRPDLALRVATGIVAHDVCAKTFVSGFEPQAVFDEILTWTSFRRVRWGLSQRTDRDAGQVTVSFAGLIRSRAVHRAGQGCTLLRGSAVPYPIAHSSEPAPPLSLRAAAFAGPSRVVSSNPQLAAAVQRGFEEPPAPPLRRTKAIVVVKDGRVIAEQYADGIDVTTPLLGYSLTKSVANALAGILVRQGRIDTSKPAPIAAWLQPGDARRAITIEQLMRMSTGLALDETNSGFDPSSRIFFLETDFAAASARAKPIAPPNTRYAYSSPSTLLLARIIGDTLGSKPEQFLAFAHRELFDPLGMRTVTLEFDVAGTWNGSSNMFASARDWARFGQLYLDDGVIDGRRILPGGWVDFSARPTLGTHYGAGFFTMRGDAPWARRWAELGIPKDAFFGTGHLGQRLIVLPSQRIVIARLGDSIGPSGDIAGFARLVADVIAATR